MSKGLPMLCQNIEVYRGPYVPVRGSKGLVTALGLKEGDVIQVVGIDVTKRIDYLGELTIDAVAIIFDPKRFEWVRAFRVQSSGSPIDVWVG